MPLLGPENTPLSKTELQVLKDFVDLVKVRIFSDTNSKALHRQIGVMTDFFSNTRIPEEDSLELVYLSKVQTKNQASLNFSEPS